MSFPGMLNIPTLISEDSSTPLESATIYLEREKDSSVVTYTISDKDGKFKLESSTYDKNLNLYVSYVGYRTYFKKLLIDKEIIDLKTIALELDNQLGEICRLPCGKQFTLFRLCLQGHDLLLIPFGFLSQGNEFRFRYYGGAFRHNCAIVYINVEPIVVGKVVTIGVAAA